MIKLYQNNKKEDKTETVEVNFSLSINVSIDMQEHLLDWLREKKIEELDNATEDEDADYFDQAQVYAVEKCKNITDEDLAEFIEEMYAYKSDIIDMILQECPEKDIDIAASMSRPLASITKND